MCQSVHYLFLLFDFEVREALQNRTVETSGARGGLPVYIFLSLGAVSETRGVQYDTLLYRNFYNKAIIILGTQYILPKNRVH